MLKRLDFVDSDDLDDDRWFRNGTNPESIEKSDEWSAFRRERRSCWNQLIDTDPSGYRFVPTVPLIDVRDPYWTKSVGVR